MDAKPLDDVIRNIDARLGRVEQILPTLNAKAELREAVSTLATKTELREAVSTLATKTELREAVSTLATKTELREAVSTLATKAELREAVSTLATRTELREAVSTLATKSELYEESERTRRHFDVVAERLEGQIKFLAEVQSAHREGMDRQIEELRTADGRLDGRVTRLEARRRR